MFSVYILFSSQWKRYYVGSTEDVETRLVQHNKGLVRSTKLFKPWTLVHTESFMTRGEAIRREHQIKSYKGGCAFHKLLSQYQVSDL